MVHVSFDDNSEVILFLAQQWKDFKKKMPRGYSAQVLRFQSELLDLMGSDLIVQSSHVADQVLRALVHQLDKALDSKESNKRRFITFFALVEVYAEQFWVFPSTTCSPEEAAEPMEDIASELRELLKVPADQLGFKGDAETRKSESHVFLESWKKWLELTNEKCGTLYTFHYEAHFDKADFEKSQILADSDEDDLHVAGEAENLEHILPSCTIPSSPSWLCKIQYAGNLRQDAPTCEAMPDVLRKRSCDYAAEALENKAAVTPQTMEKKPRLA